MYESFHYIQRQTTWGDFPWGCVCVWCSKWTLLCDHTSLLTSLFRPNVVMSDKLVAETQALRKKCSKIRETAGPRKARLILEIANQKKTSTSKIGFAINPVPPVTDLMRAVTGRDASPPQQERRLVEPSPNLPTSSDDEVYLDLCFTLVAADPSVR